MNNVTILIETLSYLTFFEVLFQATYLFRLCIPMELITFSVFKEYSFQKTATSDFVWTWGQSDAGLTLDLSSDLTSSDFSIDATGSCTASQTDVTLSGEIHYQNNAVCQNIHFLLSG